jgi:hypothetical protein
VRNARVWWLLLAVAAVVAVVVWFVSGPEPIKTTPRPERDEPVRFSHDEVAVDSARLEVGAASVRGAIHPGYTSWLVIVGCAEPDGCAGEFSVTIEYHTGTESRRIEVENRCDVPFGGEMRFEGLQDPSTPVGRIDELTLEVLERRRPGETAADEIEL